MDEIELKFLEIDVDGIEARLAAMGAVQKYDSDMESYQFLADGFSGGDSTKKYLRVRKSDKNITITYKSPATDSAMTTREEVEVQVDDYDNALLLLERLGFTRAPVFRKHRTHYELGDVHFELDTVTGIPTYLEIETKTEERMREICAALDLDIAHGRKGTIVEIYPDRFR